jgi:hypothetical protein
MFLNKNIQDKLMKRSILIIFILLININSVISAEDDWFFNSKNLVIELMINSEAKIIPEKSDYNVKYIHVNLSHFPYESFNQKVTDLDIFPDATMEGNSMSFEWENPRNSVEFGYKANFKTSNEQVKVKGKIKFPIEHIPEELEIYTKPAEIIDSNDEDVIGFASEIAEGEEDLYVVVHKVAEWTKKNIKYDLSSLTAEVSQKASWVLDNRQGVCDELTSLFIAMLRSLGIPAKFVSGVAYTNSELFTENWGSHGWAEVYFPDYGWIPYDVTYGQFGYIDPTHIKLKEGADSSEPSVQYKWVAKNVELNTDKLDIDAKVIEKIGRIEDSITLSANALRNNIKFGSYNLLEVTIRNNEDYYQSSEVHISKPKEVKIIGERSKNILLKPSEEKKIFWIMKLTDDLKDNFEYTFPITISTSRNSNVETQFKSNDRDTFHSLAEISRVLEQKKEEEQKVYSRKLEVKCTTVPMEFYHYEKSDVSCFVKNQGNVNLKEINVCFDSNCTEIDLGITRERQFNYTLERKIAGNHESIFKVENRYVSKAEYVGFVVFDDPKVIVAEITNPPTAEYGDSLEIGFSLEKNSFSTPLNLEIDLNSRYISQKWATDKLDNDKKFILSLESSNMVDGENEFSINVKFQDANGRKYSIIETFVIELVNVNLLQRILISFNQFGLFIGSFF